MVQMGSALFWMEPYRTTCFTSMDLPLSFLLGLYTRYPNQTPIQTQKGTTLQGPGTPQSHALGASQETGEMKRTEAAVATLYQGSTSSELGSRLLIS